MLKFIPLSIVRMKIMLGTHKQRRAVCLIISRLCLCKRNNQFNISECWLTGAGWEWRAWDAWREECSDAVPVYCPHLDAGCLLRNIFFLCRNFLYAKICRISKKKKYLYPFISAVNVRIIYSHEFEEKN